jgi:hypothetical protein
LDWVIPCFDPVGGVVRNLGFNRFQGFFEIACGDADFSRHAGIVQRRETSAALEPIGQATEPIPGVLHHFIEGIAVCGG